MGNIAELSSYDTFIVGVSGGKDSVATWLWALENLPPEKVVPVHNPTGAGWPENGNYLAYLEGRIGQQIVHARAGDIPLPLRRDGKPRADWYSAPSLFEMIRGRGKWPSYWQRYCTRYLKQVPIRQYAHAYPNPCLLLGVRAEESKSRAKLEQFDPGDSTYRDWVALRTPSYYPILHWPVGDVWIYLEQNHISKNPVYQHTDRVACWCCPMRSDRGSVVTFCQLYPDIAADAVSLEREIGHTWQPKCSMEQLFLRAARYG